MKIAKEDAVLGFPECRGILITYPAYVEAKFDGELGIYDAQRGKLYGKNGKARWDFPVTEQLAKLAKDLGCMFIFGELYWGEGKAGQIYDLLSNYDKDDLKFCVFDYDSDSNYEVRRAKLMCFVSMDLSQQIHLTPAEYVTCKSEFDDAFDRFVGSGYEGVVIKNPNARLVLGGNAWVKFKKKETADLMVISADETKERVGLGNPEDGNKTELCGMKVPGSSKVEREAMIGKIVEVEFLQKLFDKQGKLTGLRNPVFKRLREDKTTVNL